MKRGLILLVAFTLLTLIPFLNPEEPITGSTITGETVTGEATNANLGISIGVTVEQPSVTLLLPENKTYITNNSLFLNFSESNVVSVWYNIDLGTNITISGNTTFNTTTGGQTLYLYANNTDGNETSDNITFTINLNQFRVYYDEYFSSTKGTSSDFNKSAFEDLQNLSNVILENTDHGKILFNKAINVTNDLNFSDLETNISAHTNISSNFIEVDTINLPNFNKSATLYLYGLTFTNPRILRNGVVCSVLICTKESYVGGTLKFNVTQFTNYSAEETPGETPTPGGGGGGKKAQPDFTLSPNEIIIFLKQGEKATKGIFITNDWTKELEVTLEVPGFEDLLKISEETIKLNPGETKTISLEITIGEDTLPNLYIGEIFVEAENILKKIPIIIEIISKEPLFDVIVSLEDSRVSPGSTLHSDVEIFNIADLKLVDVEVEYEITDYQNNILIYQRETRAVEQRTSFVKKFEIKESTPEGKYILYVRVTHNGKVASSSILFEVKRSMLDVRSLLVIIIVILLAAIIFIIYEIKKIRKHIRKHHRVNERVLARERFIRTERGSGIRLFRKLKRMGRKIKSLITKKL